MKIFLCWALLVGMTVNSSAGLMEWRDRIIYHQQGWGVLGIDTAAHWPGAKPQPLRIGKQEYATGLGVHAPSETLILLNGEAIHLSLDAGVHINNEGGIIRMLVYADERLAFDSGPMTKAMPAKSVSIDLDGVRELRLVTEDLSETFVLFNVAHWANIEIEENPYAEPLSELSMDVAPFATVTSWDPAEREGTTAKREETMSEADLFPGRRIQKNAEGVYEVPVYEEGRGCIGLEWLERRRLTRLDVELDGIPAKTITQEAQFQFWRMTPGGGSRWQGRWETTPARMRNEGSTWIIEPQWENRVERMGGVLMVRFIFPAADTPIRVRAMHATTSTLWQDTTVRLSADEKWAGQTGHLEIYNGQLLDPATDGRSIEWKLDEPLLLKVRYARARPWEVTDRTVLRIALPEHRFGVAVDDVMKAGDVYVAYAELLVSRTNGASSVANYVATVDGQTILERVRAMPDQTSTQAFDRVNWAGSNSGRTLLSLACDNPKILVGRDGVITWARDPKIYNQHDLIWGHIVQDYKVAPVFGRGESTSVERRFEQDWHPIQLLEINHATMHYQQRSFVAPFGTHEQPRALTWLNHRALGVVEYTLTNFGPTPGEAHMELKITASDQPLTVRKEDGDLHLLKDDEVVATVRAVDLAGLHMDVEEGVIHINGEMAPGRSAQVILYLPLWEHPSTADLEAAPLAEPLAEQTRAYWDQVVAEGIQIELPDPFVENVIKASIMHCMVAARNEDGQRISPWISSLSYGPLESEAHSILRGMAMMGQEEFARRGLDYFLVRINEQGFLTTGYTVMGTGWHLWTIGEFYRLSADREWLTKAAPTIERACRWIMAERRKTMHLDEHGQRVPEYGLMPAGVLADWGAFAHYFYLNGNYYAGLREAGQALLDIGWPGAEEVVQDAEAYREDIRRSFEYVRGLAPVYALQDGTWVPAYPTQVYAQAPVENYFPAEDSGRSWAYEVELGSHHLIPMGVLDPDRPEAAWIINHMEDYQFLRAAWGRHFNKAAVNRADWFNLGGFAKMQPYYARTGEIHALRDDVKPFIRTYFNSMMSVLNPEDYSFWEHFDGQAVSRNFNKTHETGYFLHQTRLMLVQERGQELWLAPFVTANWLHDGMQVSVRQAPTFFGPVSYTLTSHAKQGGMEVEIAVPERSPPAAVVVRLRHPEGWTLQSAHVEGDAQSVVNAADSTIRMTSATGSLRVTAHFAP